MNRINEGKIHATEDIQIPKTNKQTKKTNLELLIYWILKHITDQFQFKLLDSGTEIDMLTNRIRMQSTFLQPAKLW